MNDTTVAVTANSPALQQILDHARGLPAMPAIVVAVLASADEPDLHIDAFAAKLACDQALTAKTLRLANSPFYGLRNRVLTPRDAITVLGLTAVRMLVTTVGLMGSLKAPPGKGFDFRAFCQHCIATGTAARLLARHVHAPEEVAFTAGLLRDIGRLLLFGHFAEAYIAATIGAGGEDGKLVAAERAALGVDHIEAGAALAKLWNFAPTVIAAIARDRGSATGESISLAEIVDAADKAAQALAADDEALQPSEDDWGRLAMSEADRESFRRELVLQLASLSAILLPAAA